MLKDFMEMVTMWRKLINVATALEVVTMASEIVIVIM